jgi:galactarate dehydratase
MLDKERTATAPVLVRMHARDNVAIVGNGGGLPAGTELPGGIVLRERVPQAHKVALTDVPAGGDVVRYGVVIGRALKDLPAGSWVTNGCSKCRRRRASTRSQWPP